MTLARDAFGPCPHDALGPNEGVLGRPRAYAARPGIDPRSPPGENAEGCSHVRARHFSRESLVAGRSQSRVVAVRVGSRQSGSLVAVITVAIPYAPVAQLDRALASGAKGRRFESCRARHPPPVKSQDTGDSSRSLLWAKHLEWQMR